MADQHEKGVVIQIGGGVGNEFCLFAARNAVLFQDHMAGAVQQLEVGRTAKYRAERSGTAQADLPQDGHGRKQRKGRADQKDRDGAVDGNADIVLQHDRKKHGIQNCHCHGGRQHRRDRAVHHGSDPEDGSILLLQHLCRHRADLLFPFVNAFIGRAHRTLRYASHQELHGLVQNKQRRPLFSKSREEGKDRDKDQNDGFCKKIAPADRLERPAQKIISGEKRHDHQQDHINVCRQMADQHKGKKDGSGDQAQKKLPHTGKNGSFSLRRSFPFLFL